MKTIHAVSISLLLASSAIAAGDVDFFFFCPPFGTATTASGKDLNRLKNRYAVPAAADFDHALTLDRLVKPGRDRSRWFNNQAVAVVGYVVRISDAAPASCDCDKPWRELRRTEIELAVSDNPRDTRPTRRLVAVVSPRMRAVMAAQGIDWSTDNLRAQFAGRYVQVEGWLLFDGEDADQARNSAANPTEAKRATAWEIHPLTAIELLPPLDTELVDFDPTAGEVAVEIQPFNFTSR